MENNVALGLAVSSLLGYVSLKRRELGRADVSLWFLLGGVFLFLSLGPVLYLNGIAIPSLPTPYSILVRLVPMLSLGGVPIRMMVMVSLCAAVLRAFGFQRLVNSTSRARIFAVALFVIMLVESLHKPFPTMSLAVPPYVQALAALPSGGVVDWVSLDDAAAKRGIPPGQMMFYQTIHQQPIARRVDELCHRFQLRYFVAVAHTESAAVWRDANVAYRDPDVVIYDLKADGECGTTAHAPKEACRKNPSG